MQAGAPPRGSDHDRYSPDGAFSAGVLDELHLLADRRTTTPGQVALRASVPDPEVLPAREQHRAGAVGCHATGRGDHVELGARDVRMWLDGNDAGPALTKARAVEISELLMQAAQFASVAEAHP